jgi:Tfp pilus assembly protein PilW
MVSAMDATRTRQSWLGSEAGFSLVELLVAAAVSLLVVGGAVVVTSQVQQGYGQQLDTASSEQEARYALDWIQRLLRQAGSDAYSIRVSPCLPSGMLPSVNGFPAVKRDPNGNGIDDDIRIFADSNPPDGLIGGPGPAPGGCTQAGEDMTVTHDAANKVITLFDNNQPALGAQTMTDSVVSNLRFAYMDRNQVTTTIMGTLAWVRVAVTTQARIRDPHTGQFAAFTLSVDVRLRPRW